MDINALWGVALPHLLKTENRTTAMLHADIDVRLCLVGQNVAVSRTSGLRLLSAG